MNHSTFHKSHPRERDVFIAAIEIESEHERNHFIAEQCADDPHLRFRIEALLSANYGKSLAPSAEQNQTEKYSGTWEPPLPADLEPAMPGYTIFEVLGRGGMGAVYRGIQKSLDREVAIKLLPPELSSNQQFASRFQREAKAMAQLNHPNIVQIYDFGITDRNHYYFVMEFVEGCDLRSYAKAGNLTSADALIAVEQICAALQYAHEKGFIHRDIKPANIFLRNDGVLKVGDFGLAKLVDPEAEKSESNDQFDLTLTGMAMGTPNYIAPEQLEGSKSIDHRADLYSLGVMFYEMLTGELPRGAVKPPSEKIKNLDVRIDDVVFKAMESKPEYRYQTATDLHTDVEAIRNTSTIEKEPSEKPVKVKAKKKSKKWFWIISGIFEVGILIFYFLILPTLKKNPPPTVPGKLHSVGKMALGQRNRLIPVDISSAAGITDLIQVTGKYRGAWAGLRADGTLLASKQSQLRSQDGIQRLGHRSGSTGALFYISDKGKILSSTTREIPGTEIPKVRSPAIDIAVHNNHGIVLYRNGKAVPFGKDYQDRKRYRPALAALKKVSGIAIGEEATAVLKRDGSITAWNKQGMIKLPTVFDSNMVAVAVSHSPGIIGLSNQGKVYSAQGKAIISAHGSGNQTVNQLKGGDGIYTPSLYQTSDGEWHLFESSKLQVAHPEMVSALTKLKGLPPEAFYLRLDSDPTSEAYLLWIEPN